MATQVNASQLKDKWQDAATQTEPDFTKLISEGFAQDGDPVQGTNATLPGAGWFNLISAMRVSVILAAGLTPETTPNPLQFLTALQSLDWMNDKTVLTKMLADAAVTAAKLASNSVETAKIKDAAVTNAKILDAAVTAAKIAAGGVGTTQLANGSVTAPKLASDFDINSLPQAWLDALMPAGEFVIMSGTTLPPRCLLCNGAAVSRTTYSRLFAAIGTRYGAGDGSETFSLPDLNGRVLQGVSDTSQVGTYLEASLPNIGGYFYSTGQEGDFSGGAFSLPDHSLHFSFPSSGSLMGRQHFEFSASKSSSVFSGTTLQPAACLCQIAIRF